MASTTIPRRQFLGGSLMAMAAPGGALVAPKAVQPDILFLMPDQMRGDCLSILEHPVVRTPNIDQLAKDGVLFRRAYSAAPDPFQFEIVPGQLTEVFVANAVPEPATMGLLALAAAGVAGYVRRRRKA